jgi:hypothetical protein
VLEKEKSIDLLLTDVILPGENGRELANEATAQGACLEWLAQHRMKGGANAAWIT